MIKESDLFDIDLKYAIVCSTEHLVGVGSSNGLVLNKQNGDLIPLHIYASVSFNGSIAHVQYQFTKVATISAE